MNPAMLSLLGNAKNQSGGFFSGLGSLFGNMSASNPYDAMSGDLSKIEPMLQKYYNPYIQAGQSAMQPLQQQYSSLMSDPSGMMKKFGQGFQADPGYQWNVDQMTKAANNAASAGGMMGSPQEQQQLAGMVGGLANQNYQDYLHNTMGLYGQGLQGMEGFNTMGYGASTGLANNLANVYMNQAQAAQRSQDWQNQNKGGFWGGVGSLIGNLF